MGGSKSYMERLEQERARARSFLVKIGTLQVCEWHGDVYDGDGDMQRAYRMFNAQVKAGKIAIEEGVTRRDMTDLLKRAYEDHSLPDACPSCERDMED